MVKWYFTIPFIEYMKSELREMSEEQKSDSDGHIAIAIITSCKLG
ncbi:hypothetical protein [Candidatus Harpocratesius sp.]